MRTVWRKISLGGAQTTRQGPGDPMPPTATPPAHEPGTVPERGVAHHAHSEPAEAVLAAFGSDATAA